MHCFLLHAATDRGQCSAFFCSLPRIVVSSATNMKNNQFENESRNFFLRERAQALRSIIIHMYAHAKWLMSDTTNVTENDIDTTALNGRHLVTL